MISRLYLSLLFVVVLNTIPIIAHAAERHALVIGNSSYKPFALAVTTTDATDMAGLLQAMGYKVFSNGPLLNLNRESIERTIDEFAQSLPLGANAVFYYAGHGMATERDSYLLPINSDLKFQSDIRDRTVSLRSIVETLKSYNPRGVNVLLLDASRNNPLTSNFLGIKNGLDRLREIPEGVFIGFASTNGQTSANHAGSINSAYTKQLIATMTAQPGLGIKAMHKLVASTVLDNTNGAQLPVSEDRIYGSWCFDDCGAIPITQLQSPALPNKPLANINVKPSRNYWKIAGGVALGLAVFALTNSSDDGGNDPIAVSLNPPGQ